MTEETLASRLESLPLVLAGPILRRTEKHSVTVWVALKAPRKVTLQIFNSTGTVMFSGSRHTYKLGKNLHVVAVTAAGTVGGRDTPLESNELYFYDLDFGDAKVSDHNSFGDRIYCIYDKITDTRLKTCPSFVLPPSDLNKLRILHGSCRKPHGEGRDVLETVDRIIASSIKPGSLDVSERPQQLFLTGDQIYADDVTQILLSLLMDAATVLLGWEEELGDLIPFALRPGNRSLIAKNRMGLIAEPKYMYNHLFRFGEFCAMYLFAWSDVLWPATLPRLDAYHKFLEPELNQLESFRRHLPAVRRALANIPTYMAIDDHEVTDDWNFNQTWCEKVYSKELGRTFVQNALASYAIFQGWGNTPSKFTLKETGEQLLDAVVKWSSLNGKDAASREIWNKCVGVPGDYVDGIKKDFKVVPNNSAIRWDYQLEFPGYEVLVLDTRCFRAFDKSPYPKLLGTDGFKLQLRDRSVSSETELTIVISASPIIFSEQIEAHLRTDALGLDAEGWGQQVGALSAVLAALAERGARTVGTKPDEPKLLVKTRVVVLSGDIHSSFTAQVQFRATAPYGSVRAAGSLFMMDLAQLTSSAFQNEDEMTRKFHQVGVKGEEFIIAGIGNPTAPEHHGWANPEAKSVYLGDLVRPNMGITKLKMSGTPLVVSVPPDASATLLFNADWSFFSTIITDKTLSDNIPRDPKLPVLPPPPGDRSKALRQYLAMASNAADYAPTNGVGHEIVGVSNLGEVTFSWPANSEEKVVTHSLWWRLEGKKGQLQAFPLTTCKVPLDFSEPEFKAQFET